MRDIGPATWVRLRVVNKAGAAGMTDHASRDLNRHAKPARQFRARSAELPPALYTRTQRVEEIFNDDLLTVTEVAQLLKVPVSWVYERTRRRGFDRIPHFKLGKYLRFSEREVADWLQKVRG